MCAVALLVVFLMKLPVSSSLFDKLPRNADIFVLSNHSDFLKTLLNSCSNYPNCNGLGHTLSVLQHSKVETVLDRVNDPSSNSLVLLLKMSNNSDTLIILQKIFRFYFDESKLKRYLTIFKIMNHTPTSNKSLLHLLGNTHFSQIPWQIALFFIELNDSNNIVELSELITISGNLSIRAFSTEGVSSDFFETFFSRRFKEDLNGVVVRALAVDNADERYSAEFNKNGSSLTFFEGGYTVNLLKDLQDTLNFTVVAVSGTDYITDASVNNTVGGVGTQLLNLDGDLVISMSYALDFRLQYLSPTIAFNKDLIRVFFRQPSQFLERNIFLHPFSDLVWITLLITLGLIAISTFLVANLQIRTKKTYFWILGALCQKSCSNVSEKTPGRVILFVTFIMSWLIYTFYSASVISRLSVSYNPITTLMELISAQFKLLADPLVSYTKFLQLTSTQDWEKTFVSEVDAVAKVFMGGHGFITSIDLVVIASRNLGHSEQEICDTVSSVTFFEISMPLHFYTRKGYQFKDLINRKLLNAIEKGFNHRYLKEFLWHTNPVCPVMTQTTFQSLGLSDVYSVFFGLTFMFCVTLIVLIIEKLLSKFRKELIVNRKPKSNLEFSMKGLGKIRNFSNNANHIVQTDM